MVRRGLGSKAWNVALVASLGLAALAATSSPVASHDPATPGEQPGHDGSSSDPLNAFQWFGPADTPIEDKVCPNANRYVGTGHIDHIYAFEGINPEPENWIEPGTHDFWHHGVWEDPRGLEGALGSDSSMYDKDGFGRARFTGSVVDGAGYDLRVHDYHPWSSGCFYGGIERNGPFFFLGTAFQDQPDCEGQFSCLNMAFIYRDLYQEYYNTTATPKMDYIFGVGSVERYPGLRADFHAVPSDQPSGWAPGTNVQYVDDSIVYGFPDPSQNQGGIVTDEDMMYTTEDPIVDWAWYYDMDPSPDSEIVRCGQYCYTSPSNDNGEFPAPVFYPEVGRYETCLVVTTVGIPSKGIPPRQDDECKNYRVRDADPIAAFTVNVRGCFFPAVQLESRSFEPPNTPVVRHEWEFGDATTSTANPVEHVYEASNVYTIRLTVWDNDGDTATTERVVQAVGSDDCGNPPDTSLDEGSGGSGTPGDASRSGDYDGDGIPDGEDACPAGGSAETGDLDGDGVGDGCDEDRDGDLVDNHLDTCPTMADRDQLDGDGDGIGDACDLDADEDGVQDVGGNGRATDNCRLAPNPEQADLDADDTGDACDLDRDGDLVPNLQDTYPDDVTRWSDALRASAPASLREREGVQVFAAGGAGGPWLGVGLLAALAVAVAAVVLAVRRRKAE